MSKELKSSQTFDGKECRIAECSVGILEKYSAIEALHGASVQTNTQPPVACAPSSRLGVFAFNPVGGRSLSIG